MNTITLISPVIIYLSALTHSQCEPCTYGVYWVNHIATRRVNTADADVHIEEMIKMSVFVRRMYITQRKIVSNL